VGPLGRKGRPPIGKVGEWYVKSRHLQGCGPRLCRLRTDGLAPASKYWTYRSHVGDMCPVSLVAHYRQKFDLRLLLHLLACERNWVRTHRSIDRRAEDCVGSPFSQEQWDPFKSVGNLWKIAMRWPREIYMVWDHTRTERGMRVTCWSSFPLHGVHRFESSRLSDMSIACLWQSSRR
jgi:hypothetical protein